MTRDAVYFEFICLFWIGVRGKPGAEFFALLFCGGGGLNCGLLKDWNGFIRNELNQDSQTSFCAVDNKLKYIYIENRIAVLFACFCGLLLCFDLPGHYFVWVITKLFCSVLFYFVRLDSDWHPNFK